MAKSNCSVFVKDQFIDAKDVNNAAFTTAFIIRPSEEVLEETRYGIETINASFNDATVTDFGFEDKLTIREWMEREINGADMMIKRFVGRLYVPAHGLHLVCATLTGGKNFMHLGTHSQQDFDGAWLNSAFFYGNLDAIKAVANQTVEMESSHWEAYKAILKVGETKEDEAA
mgnify:FL=1